MILDIDSELFHLLIDSTRKKFVRYGVEGTGYCACLGPFDKGEVCSDRLTTSWP